MEIKERQYKLNEVVEMDKVEYTNETIFVTDPCYIIPEEVWDKFVHYSPDEIETALRNLGYEKPILVNDTGFGDWGNRLFNPETNEDYGSFGADAGMFIVCALSDVLKNNKRNLETKEKAETYGAVIENFTGTVKYSYEYYTSYGLDSRLAIIEGDGNIKFRSISSQDDEE